MRLKMWVLAGLVAVAGAACSDAGPAADTEPGQQRSTVVVSSTVVSNGAPPSSTVAPDSSPSVSAAPPSSSKGRLSENASAGSLLNLYLYGGRSPQLVQYDVETLTAECMRAAGWEYVVSSPPSSSPLTFSQLKQAAATHGYGIADGSGSPLDADESFESSLDQNLEIQQSLSEQARGRYLAALVGDAREGEVGSEPGCRQLAEEEAHRDVPFFDPAYSEVTFDFLEQLETDPQYSAAIGEWSACMRSRGYDFTTPDAARGSMFESFQQVDRALPAAVEAFRVGEIATATADYDCYETHVLSVRVEVEDRILAEMVDAGRLPPLPDGGDG